MRLPTRYLLANNNIIIRDSETNHSKVRVIASSRNDSYKRKQRC
jgi:hypothetical protein